MLITCPKCSVKYQIPPEIKLSDGKKMQCSACGHTFEFHLEQETEAASSSSLLPPEDAVLSFDSTVKTVTVKTKKVSSDKDENVLPEAFRPLQNVPPKMPSTFSYFWIFACVILLIGLIFMGWLWRDLLLMKNPFSSFTPVSVPVRTHKSPSVKPVVSEAPVIPLFIDEETVPSQNDAPLPQLSIQSVRFRKTPTGEAVLMEGVLKNNTPETLPIPEKIYALAYDTKGALAFEKEIYLPSGVLPPNMEQPFFGTYAPVKEEIQWIDVVLKK